MKKSLLLATLAVSILGLSSCENYKLIGNKMSTGSMTYYYALVYSKITDTRYYHIQGWAEYGPDGIDIISNETVGGTFGNYVGIELQLVNGDVIYRYEPQLSYELSKQINNTYATTYGIIGD